MTIRRFLSLSATTIFCLSCMGCSTLQHHVLPLAEIGRDSARFVFPSKLESAFEWPRQESGAPVVREYQWTVRWYPVARELPPIEIAVTIEDSLQIREGPLHRLLRDARIQTYELSLNREPGGLRFLRDPELLGSAIAVHTERGAVVLTVRGARAITRLFPQTPDSVEMGIPHVMSSDNVDVPVRKRR